MGKRVVVTGGKSGLGKEIILQLKAYAAETFCVDKENGWDVTSKSAMEQFVSVIDYEQIDVLINCAGINKIEFMENMTEHDWDEVMNTNAKSIFLVSQTLLPLLSPGGAIINIVSNASHVPMTNSLAYNASKAAAHMMTLQMARELKPRHNITVLGVSPNKLRDTGMSRYIDKRVCELRGWTPEEAEAYQLKCLPAGEETDPAAVARFICHIIMSGDIRFLNGCVMPYGA